MRHYNRCTVNPISDYINNPVFQEHFLEMDYFDAESDEKIYLDLRESLGYTEEIENPNRNDSILNVATETKAVLNKKIRLRI